MLKLILTIVILFICTMLFANDKVCQISMFPKILIISETVNDLEIEEFIESSNCPKELQGQIAHLLSQLEGPIPSNYLSTLVYEDTASQKVYLTPSTILVSRLKKVLSSGNSLEKNHFFSTIKPIGGKSSIGYFQDQEIVIDCLNCNSTGEKNIKISVHRSKQGQVFWAVGKLVERTKVLRASLPLPAQSLLEGKFDLVYGDVEQPSQLYVDEKNLKFFKTNKPLEKGSILRTTDLVPINLASFGDRVKILVNSRNLRIQMEGEAKQNGGLGDEIRVFNPKGKKEITGKLIDFKTVEVQI